MHDRGRVAAAFESRIGLPTRLAGADLGPCAPMHQIAEPHGTMSVAPSRHERIFHPDTVRSLCVHIRRRGVPLADALAGTGMTWQKLLHEKRSIAFDPMRTLILTAKELTGCPSLGLE